MAREYAPINIAIWQDDDFRDLPRDAQHLFFVLWTHPSLSYAGVADWRPGRLAALAGDWTTDDVEKAAACLEARLFLVIDRDTEECLIRSWVRFDGLLKQPRMAVSFANAFAEIASKTVRGVLVHQMQRLHELQPELAGWAKPQVAAILTRDGIDPRARTLPKDPFAPGFGHGFTPAVTPGFGPGLGETLPDVSVPPTPAPTPTPNSYSQRGAANAASSPEEARPARGTRLPESWAPTSEHVDRAKAAGLDLDREVVKFRAHADEKGRVAKSWNSAFTRWLINAEEFAHRDRGNNRRPTTDDRVAEGMAVTRRLAAEAGITQPHPTFPMIGAPR